MTPALSAIEAAISEAARLDKVLKAGRPRVQVTLFDERALAKATCLTWFNNHRPVVAEATPVEDLGQIDQGYKAILESSERAGARSKYLSTLKLLKRDLVNLRSRCISSPTIPAVTTELPPPFSRLIADQEMQTILNARWSECSKCLEADAPLAATVMMGGLLEALLLSRINREADKKRIFTAKHAPKDKQGNPRSLSEWMLKDYIDVTHELGWITVSAKDIGAVLRDYRNYIHPQKQLSHGVQLIRDDAQLFWEISKNITRQIVKSAK